MSRGIAPVAAALVVLVGLVAFLQVRETPESAISGDLPTPEAYEPHGEDETVIFEIFEGETAGEIADALEKAGIIESARLFRTIVALTGVEDQLGAGEYEFQVGQPVMVIIDQIRGGGEVARLRVLVPEGRRLEEIAEIMEVSEIGLAGEFMAALDAPKYDFDFLARIPRGQGMEGYLFPATYLFEKDVEAEAVVEAMLQAFDDNVTQELIEGMRAQGLTLHEGVTLASIVEREARLARERPVIASVYLNRLENGMRLQADPTTQYAVANADPDGVEEYGWWKAELTVDDLALDSPYNTYAHDGLPPGPIAAPGLASMEAVANPADTNFLFFVACGEDGRHEFAATLTEHEANVARCQGG